MTNKEKYNLVVDEIEDIEVPQNDINVEG